VAANNRGFVRGKDLGFLRCLLYLLKAGKRAIMRLYGGLGYIKFDLLVERYKESSPYPEKPISQKNRNPNPLRTEIRYHSTTVSKIQNPSPTSYRKQFLKFVPIEEPSPSW